MLERIKYILVTMLRLVLITPNVFQDDRKWLIFTLILDKILIKRIDCSSSQKTVTRFAINFSRLTPSMSNTAKRERDETRSQRSKRSKVFRSSIDYNRLTRLPGRRWDLLVVLVIEDQKQCSLPMDRPDTFKAILLNQKSFLLATF